MDIMSGLNKKKKKVDFVETATVHRHVRFHVNLINLLTHTDSVAEKDGCFFLPIILILAR